MAEEAKQPQSLNFGDILKDMGDLKKVSDIFESDPEDEHSETKQLKKSVIASEGTPLTSRSAVQIKSNLAKVERDMTMRSSSRSRTRQ